MVVYVEILLLDNFFVDLLIGYCAVWITGHNSKKAKQFLSAAAGSLLTLPLPYIPGYFSILYKVFVLLICTFILYFKKNVRGYLKITLIYSVISFLLAGIIVWLFNMESSDLTNTFVYDRGGLAGFTALGMLLLLYFIRQIIGFNAERHVQSKLIKASIINKDISLDVTALIDTGNLLLDSNGRSVVVANAEVIAKIGELEQMGDMVVNSATGSKILHLVKLPQMKIYYSDSVNTLENITVALSDMAYDKYQLIIADGM